MVGRFMLVAPSSSPGVVLSQPPISTTPSTGWPRNSSSASIASMLRYSMVVGFRKDSDSDNAGNSIGKALAVAHAALERQVAGLRVRPGIEDRDHGAVLPLLRRVAHLHGAGAVAEGAQIVGREPARSAERFRAFFLLCHNPTRSRPIRSSHRRSVPGKPAFQRRWRMAGDFRDRYGGPDASRGYAIEEKGLRGCPQARANSEALPRRPLFARPIRSNKFTKQLLRRALQSAQRI